MKTTPSFRTLCRCLCDSPSDSPDALQVAQDKNTDWSEVARIADGHFVTPLLYYRLVQKYLLSLLPEDLQILLGEIYKLNRLRNDLIYDEINCIAAQLNPAGIEPIFLKGSAALLMDIYDDRGLRVMNDVDLLVSKKDLSICMDLMLSIGYHPMEGVNLPPGFYHQNPLVHKRHSIRFEIHEQLDSNPILDSEVIIRESTVIPMPDGIVRVPSKNHFAVHNILHHQLFDKGLLRNRMPLYQLYDLYTIRKKCCQHLDWRAIYDVFKSHYLKVTCYKSIGMLLKYFDQSPPQEIRFFTAKMWSERIIWSIIHHYRHIMNR